MHLLQCLRREEPSRGSPPGLLVDWLVKRGAGQLGRGGRVLRPEILCLRRKKERKRKTMK